MTRQDDPAALTATRLAMALTSLAVLLVTLVLSPWPLQAAERVLYSIASNDNKLRSIDPADGTTLSEVTITLDGPSFTNGTGLASDPTTGRLLAILKRDDMFRNRMLVEIDPETGAATRLDTFGNASSVLRGMGSLAFDDDGTLYGSTSSNGPNAGEDFANTLFVIDQNTGEPTAFRVLSPAFAGTALAFNPSDGEMYHLTGSAFQSQEAFERIDLTTKDITDIGLSGSAVRHAMALTYTAEGDFLGVERPNPSPEDQTSNLISITVDGEVSVLGELDHLSKGLAFLPPVGGAGIASDFDGDGNSDILWHHVQDGRNKLWFMDGLSRDGQGSPPPFANTDWEVAGLGDFDGDGQSDILWHNAVNGKNRIWLMEGAMRLSSANIEKFASIKWQVAGVADHDGDGLADILWRHSGNGRNQIRLMEGTSRKAAGSIPRLANVAWEVQGSGDSDGDNRADIYWRNAEDGRNKVWLMDGLDRKGQGNLPVLANANWQVAGFADFDGDRNADILWRHIGNGKNQIWRLDGATRKSRSNIPAFANTAWGVATLGDYDGDRRADILWRHSSNGRNRIWLMEGFVRKAQGAILKLANTLFEAQ